MLKKEQVVKILLCMILVCKSFEEEYILREILRYVKMSKVDNNV